METFKSPEVIVNKSAEELFNKIGNLNNLKEIMPSQIEGFESTEATCSFNMQGMPRLTLEIYEKIEFSKISLKSRDSQIPFSLNCLITEKENQCKARIEINIQANMMMKMMIEKPINQFLNILADKMKNL